MMDAYILSWVTFIYFTAFTVYLALVTFRRPVLGTIASAMTLGGLGLHTVGLIIRWKMSYDLGIGHAPLANFYESLVFFSWS
ncbi:MAG: c-type cytochrome biogenesis protein CcsB, partial [Syntrophales bacterium]|nr:c-type cytochrome biogenesis protein CcsB [Syntrophales bacterium]